MSSFGILNYMHSGTPLVFRMASQLAAIPYRELRQKISTLLRAFSNPIDRRLAPVLSSRARSAYSQRVHQEKRDAWPPGAFQISCPIGSRICRAITCLKGFFVSCVCTIKSQFILIRRGQVIFAGAWTRKYTDADFSQIVSYSVA